MRGGLFGLFGLFGKVNPTPEFVEVNPTPEFVKNTIYYSNGKKYRPEGKKGFFKLGYFKSITCKNTDEKPYTNLEGKIIDDPNYKPKCKSGDPTYNFISEDKPTYRFIEAHELKQQPLITEDEYNKYSSTPIQISRPVTSVFESASTTSSNKKPSSSFIKSNTSGP